MRDYLLKIAKALNILLLVTIVGLVLTNGVGNIRGEEVLILVLVLVTPAFTLFALFAPEGK